ncbi:RimK family alpha-L-glutamate ligase [Chromobacterium sp. IIBBL 290-4]|uniref:ATP-grasp domain-containing protein n=1 Tax=Chromobacterium sp. IIBBL 290-4 TaxID=2953890 RepID=UPI0020B8ECCD|nr:hypothetical protein [Chromobacterium sp. IIBBL 290-4]UTH75792.1 hypothetical protein NKT35_06740 [Chromobacterium sp. IIBBL 290-4]
MKVLVVTHSNDKYCPPLVMEALQKQGAQAIRLDTDCFPTEVKINLSYRGAERRMFFKTADGDVELDELDAIYCRRFSPAGKLPDDMDIQYKRTVHRESYATLLGMLSCSDTFQLDPYDVVSRAENKPLQLKLAQQLGFTVPETLSGNDPEEVRAFFHRHPDGIVAKVLKAFSIQEEGREMVMYTNRLQESHLGELDRLALGPLTFQQLIPKALELRVTVVGERIFAASVDSQGSEKSQTDWRRDGLTLQTAWSPYQLPMDVERKILRLMDILQLNYGALDFILTPQGELVFLEINPAGEFVWMQTCTGFPIADALAEVLLGKAPRRETYRFGTPRA